jgi:hypothetical protein
VNPHFASLVLGLSHQAEAALGGQLPPGAEELGDTRKLAQTLIDTLGQAVTSLRFRYVQTMPKP